MSSADATIRTPIDVLYVDDDAGLLTLTKDYLETRHTDISVTTANDVQTALDVLADGVFDAIVSDYQMPGMDGLEFLEVLRQERGSSIPFIIFTGRGREEVAMEALNLGANRYLQKGGDPRSQYGMLVQAIEQEVDHYHMREALGRREENLRITMEAIGDAVIATDADGIVTRMNQVAETLTGWDRSEAIGSPLDQIFDIVDQETREPVENPVETVLREGRTVDLANGTMLRTRTGIERYIADSAAPITRDDGTIAGVVLVFRDVTDRYRTRQREARQHRTLVELSSESAITSGEFDRAARTITEAATRTLDVERASIWFLEDDGSTLRCADLYERTSDRHSSDIELAATEYPRYFDALAENRSIAVDDAQNDPRTAAMTDEYLEPLGITSMLDATVRSGGEVVGVICHEHVGEAREWTGDEARFAAEMADQVLRAIRNRDANERERRLANQNQRLTYLIEQSPLAIVEWDLDRRVTRWNDVAEEVFGYSAEQAMGQSMEFIVPPGARHHVADVWDDVVAGGISHSVNENVRADGETVDCEWHNRAIRDDDGEVLSVFSMIYDVDRA